ncbi:hypothetical protein FHR81_001838 [Actinoalloteichus hoggarensis]|uniref:Uncharacterized protein n=1 Tax=Actinoalloteichus hoggarensis TaxID=1470176 RepID=A0A221W5J1_9PSEU|nr:hypothetical protein [Actinoalloteichus hoggarensis]ASO20869.1 hypothetical protein AHOG_16215 [Actinoalloteichus hoggarensis]MBB5920800.1 hypothetical protein [Actinoalloteichus hoggarensis]
MGDQFLSGALDTAGDHLFPVVAATGIALLAFGALDCAWRCWRQTHPRRRSPSRRDWARIRAAETRVAANR